MILNLSTFDMVIAALFIIGMIGMFFYLKMHTNTVSQMSSDMATMNAAFISEMAHFHDQLTTLQHIGITTITEARKEVAQAIMPEPTRPAPAMPAVAPSKPESAAFSAAPVFPSAQALRDAVAASAGTPFFYEVNLFHLNGTAEVLNPGQFWITNYREQPDGTVSR
jgi:hypothetical protein